MFLQPNQASTSLNLVLTPFSPIIVLYFREKLGRSRISLRGGWGRLPLAVVICFAGQLSALLNVNTINPGVIDSWPTATYLMLAGAAFSFLVGPIQLMSPIENQCYRIATQIYWLFWIFAVINLFDMVTNAYGEYHISPYLAFFGQILSLVFSARSVSKNTAPVLPEMNQAPVTSSETIRDLAGNADQGDTTEAGETTPLLLRVKQSRWNLSLHTVDVDEALAAFFQIIVVVPFLIWYTVYRLKEWETWGLSRLGEALLATQLFVVLFFPFAVYAHRIPKAVTAVVLLLSIGLTVFNLLVVPYSSAYPFRVDVQQTLNIDG
ncbi:hypothetical protein BT69DRAFT_928171 [Atractiella rhizophila]|nr:hypothetical protein BT69DRAFT_928171 [Atractiella rhizophila]